MASGGKDERRARRYNVRNFELYCLEGGLFSALFKPKAGSRLPVVNFSVGGAQFLANRQFREGDRMRISLYVPTLPEPLALEAAVCWCQQVPRRSAYRVGVRFGGTEQSGAQRLHEIEASVASLTIKIICEHCKSSLAVKKKYEGTRARCPKCGQAIEVREPEVLPELDAEKRSAEAAAALPGGGGPAGYRSLRPQFVHFLKTAIRSRLHLDLVQCFTKGERGQVAGSRELGVQLNVSERKVYEALRELVSRGILKEIGVRTFNYDPIPAARQSLAELATALASPGKRSEVLAVVLETEKGAG